jgi:hypothetical protein
LVLPDADDSPAKGAELSEVASITLPVGSEFFLPKRGELMLPNGEPPTVPEVTIYEDRNLLLRKYDVR